ncbi:MAG TPA: biopolymer transporter ExbD [Candidatus Angelobacter sp.]|nr:biopolymer transporter ExbD [Candidatus Angelobacter sp.]
MAMMPGSRRGLACEMNVTPMIDVLLVLLIIFMIVLPHTTGEKAELPQKSTDGNPPPPDSTIVIALHQVGEEQRPDLTINHKSVKWEDLEDRLRDIYLRRVEKVAFLKGDADVYFEYVAEVVDMTHHAGVDRVGLLGQSD